MGVLLLIALATAAAGIVTVVLMLNAPPLPPARFLAVLSLTFSSSAVTLYCYGWFSIAFGAPFPDLCESRSVSGADLTSIEEAYWPLRSACVYADGSTVEHVSSSITALVCVLAGLAVVAGCAGAALRGRGRSHRLRTVLGDDATGRDRSLK
ncbi:hypothetical protein [Streptomyces sp. CRN 30]|uniref:hypothetical protein n=1 Tax=Streptomyces sp. CRN 30 TaxID=3075613 RepID=UPI002A8363A8|nr:hypothetical protein [Streptomyces sp. CRN 30]